MMRSFKESDRLCEEAFLEFKMIQADISMPSVELRVSYSGSIGTKRETVYLPNALFTLINSVQLLRNSSKADLLQTESDSNILSDVRKAMQLVLDNYSTSLKLTIYSELHDFMRIQTTRVSRLSVSILVLTVLEVVIFGSKIAIILLICKQVYSRFGTTIRVFGLISVEEAFEFVDRCDMFREKYILHKDRYKVDGEVYSELDEDEYDLDEDDEPSEQDDPMKLHPQFSFPDQPPKSDEFYSRRVSELEALDQLASPRSKGGNGLEPLSFALGLQQEESTTPMLNQRGNPAGNANELQRSFLGFEQASTPVRGSSRMMSAIHKRRGAGNANIGSQVVSQMKRAASKEGSQISNGGSPVVTRRTRKAYRAGNIEMVLKGLQEGVDESSPIKGEGRSSMQSRSSLDNKNSVRSIPQDPPVAVETSRADGLLAPTSRSTIVPMTSHHMLRLTTREDAPMLSIREQDGDHGNRGEYHQELVHEAVIEPAEIKLTIPKLQKAAKKNYVQPKTLLSERDEDIEDSDHTLHKITYQGEFLSEPLKRCAIALAVWLPVCLYTLFRDYLNFQEYNQYKTHVLTTFRIQSELKHLQTYTYITVSSSDYFNPESLSSPSSAFTGATSSVAASLRAATAAQPGTLGGESTHFSTSFSTYTSITETVFQRSLCQQTLVTVSTPTLQRISLRLIAECQNDPYLRSGVLTTLSGIVEAAQNLTTTLMLASDRASKSAEILQSYQSLPSLGMFGLTRIPHRVCERIP